MDWTNIVSQLFEVVLFPLLSIGTVYVIFLIKVKIAELKEKTTHEKQQKYLDMLDKTIAECVLATTQTYVDALKKQGSFNEEAQKIAFEQMYNAVMTVLADDAKIYIETFIGDFETYVNNKIEAEVRLNKY